MQFIRCFLPKILNMLFKFKFIINSYSQQFIKAGDNFSISSNSKGHYIFNSKNHKLKFTQIILHRINFETIQHFLRSHLRFENRYIHLKMCCQKVATTLLNGSQLEHSSHIVKVGVKSTCLTFQALIYIEENDWIGRPIWNYVTGTLTCWKLC